MPNYFKQSNTGFTLIEMLMVISLTTLLMLTATSLFMSTLVSNTKAVATQQVKNEGEYAMGQMEFLLRNAIELTPNLTGELCASDMASIAFKSLDNGVTTLMAQTDATDQKLKIASNSGIYLTSGSIDLVNGPIFTCQQSTDDRRHYINITFTLRKGSPDVDKAKDIVEETFTTGVSMRN